jgi:prephenate dehydrogenase
MKIYIEGIFGNFGFFLKDEFMDAGHIIIGESEIQITEYYDAVILAVPLSAYEECAKKHAGKTLINVCSVQEESTEICNRYSKNVISIHPMFGRRSPDEGKTCVLTYASNMKMLKLAYDLFTDICENVVSISDGVEITPKMHDEMMALTHVKVIELSDKILEIVMDAKHIPNELLPTSFKRLRDMAVQFLDMPEGTKSSIMANKYKK